MSNDNHDERGRFSSGQGVEVSMNLGKGQRAIFRGTVVRQRGDMVSVKRAAKIGSVVTQHHVDNVTKLASVGDTFTLKHGHQYSGMAVKLTADKGDMGFAGEVNVSGEKRTVDRLYQSDLQKTVNPHAAAAAKVVKMKSDAAGTHGDSVHVEADKRAADPKVVAHAAKIRARIAKFDAKQGKVDAYTELATKQHRAVTGHNPSPAALEKRVASLRKQFPNGLRGSAVVPDSNVPENMRVIRPEVKAMLQKLRRRK